MRLDAETLMFLASDGCVYALVDLPRPQQLDRTHCNPLRAGAFSSGIDSTTIRAKMQ
jgi:hypothetical protein